jgi:hypothetical protein
MTFLKSNAGKRDNLKQFIRLNWFAMDLIAENQGLMSSYHLFETDSDDGEWNVVVQVVYPNEKGYDGIKEEFEKIRAAHKTILVNGKSLRDLGAIVRSQKTFEDLPSARK